MATTTGDPVTASVAFSGLWVHDPDDPEATITQYRYGRAQRSLGVAVTQETTHFVGRVQPVTDFGEHQTDTFDVTIDVPFGTDYRPARASLRAWAEARRAVVVRDNRGRMQLSTLDGHDESDTEWGGQVSLTATRVDSSAVPGVG